MVLKQKNRKLSIILHGNRRDNNKILTNQIRKIESVPQPDPFQPFETVTKKQRWNVGRHFWLVKK